MKDTLRRLKETFSDLSEANCSTLLYLGPLIFLISLLLRVFDNLLNESALFID